MAPFFSSQISCNRDTHSASTISFRTSSPDTMAHISPMPSPSPSAQQMYESKRSSNLTVPSYFASTTTPQSLSTLDIDLLSTTPRSRQPSHASQMSMQSNAKPIKQAPSRSASITEPCVVCSSTSTKTYTCIQCNNYWSKERPHRPGAVGFDGRPHEKTDKKVVDRLRKILEPKRSPQEQQQQHKIDEGTTWFGTARDSANLPIFQDYGRYAKIMAQSRLNGHKVRYPQLVSFVGQTGAGKNTLVKMFDRSPRRRIRE
ncbi:hypothetical protein OCU04_006775 [Sclerotinia nivalis]|uniref:Uncharacterized protein n=1 Tax=Sclerotinia nivalis TaxID=352851 RepID=A0A9X0AKF4_9HELO|nr:hypothetical protein OCU04_006775 [Sclerotinia nivalis]